MAEAVKAAASARAASPFLAIGWPSMMVAWEPAPPGTLNRIEVIELAVLLTAQMLMIRQMASNLLRTNAIGNRSAMAVLLPMPGIATRVELMMMPNIISPNAFHWRMPRRPAMAASIIYPVPTAPDLWRARALPEDKDAPAGLRCKAYLQSTLVASSPGLG